MTKLDIFSTFSRLYCTGSFCFHSSNDKWKYFDMAKTGMFITRWKSTHHICLTAWFAIICLNKCHVRLYCLSSDSNTSVYWQLFWKHNSAHGTNERTWQGKCTANDEWTQFAKRICTYKQREANWTLQRAGRVWILNRIYLAIHFSEGLISNGTIEAVQKYNTVSNMAEEVKNKVNERFNKAP